MALLRSVLRGRNSLLVELALLSPVVALAVLGGVEVRRVKAVEAALAFTASQIATAGLDSSEAAESRRGLSLALSVSEDQIVVAADTFRNRVTVSVPCAGSGSTLARFWGGAQISGASDRAVD